MDLSMPDLLLPIIQLAITPVILLSGTGMLILSLTNRMARVVDRTRNLADLMRSSPTAGAANVQSHRRAQIAILWRRAGLLRAAVTCVVSSMLVSCLLVIVIFLGQMLGREFSIELAGLFILDMALLIAALLAFLRDIFLSLHALQLEVAGATGDES